MLLPLPLPLLVLVLLPLRLPLLLHKRIDWNTFHLNPFTRHLIN